jgi:aromatic ring-opening dioxygenase catalytic subunit (LigB family)
MSTDDKGNDQRGLTRRQTIAGIGASIGALVGAGALANISHPSANATPVGGTSQGGTSQPMGGTSQAPDEKKAANGARMPAVYLPHGGGPWPFVDLGFGDKAETDELAAYLRSISSLPKTPPRALLVISAHWEEPVPTVMTSASPPMFYDYYGFPPASYQIQWPAPGAPAVAKRVQELLGAAGIATATDAERGYDHGTFVPLKLAYPDADVPVVQLSLKAGLDPAEHIAIGRALAPLRDEGVFIIGSGMTFHNLRAFRDPRSIPVAETFDAWLRGAATASPAERDKLLVNWEQAPAARAAHPREEHLIPLMVIAGAAGTDRGTIPFNGTFAGLRLSAYHYG